MRHEDHQARRHARQAGRGAAVTVSLVRNDKPRPSECPTCGDRGVRAHTGTYCEHCGETIV